MEGITVIQIQVTASVARSKMRNMLLLCTDQHLRNAANAALDDSEPVAVALLAGRRLLALAQLRGVEDGDLPGVTKVHLRDVWWLREASKAAVCAVFEKWNLC